MTVAPDPTVSPPVDHTDPFGRDVLEDPQPLHAALRDAGPLVHLRSHDVYALARYREVRSALVDWQAFQSGAGVGLSNFRFERPSRPPNLLLEADPPRHDAPRRVLERILTPASLRRLRARWFADARELVDQVLDGGEQFDAVGSLAEAFPLRVLPDAVGVSRAGREQLIPLGDHTFNAFGPADDVAREGEQRLPDLMDWADSCCRRDSLAPDSIGSRIWAAADRGDVAAEQAPLIIRSLLLAGVNTTVHGLSATLHAFASHPEQWRRLREDPRLARVAFDEAVRWASPVQTCFRTTTTDVRVGRHIVPDGAKILMFLGAANRDPRRWNEPDDFDLSRDPSGHVGFGMGIHQCVGKHVARLAAEALLTALADRVRRVELAAPTVRHHNNTLRGWRSVPVRVRLA